MMNRGKGLLARLTFWMDELLFPENVLCLCCDHALGEEDQEGVCRSCAMALEALAVRQQTREEREKGQDLPEGIAYVHAAFAYEGPARRLVHRLKYESVRSAAVPLAAAMTMLPSGEEEVIVPVPTDRLRMKKRGFNQATLLAEYIGKELGMQVCSALVRVDSRRPQTGLSAAERLENLAGCMRSDESVSGKHVLLVDDVYTTGATVKEAARALRKAGAAGVGVFAAAQALDMGDEPSDPFEPACVVKNRGKSPENAGKTCEKL